MKIPFLKITQPIGSFYMTSIKASELIKIVRVIPRSESNDGVQRDLSVKRVSELADFCNDSDADVLIPYALFATFEMAPEYDIDVYQTVLDKVRTKDIITPNAE